MIKQNTSKVKHMFTKYIIKQLAKDKSSHIIIEEKERSEGKKIIFHILESTVLSFLNVYDSVP